MELRHLRYLAAVVQWNGYREAGFLASSQDEAA
jgi:hypothetical protein